MNYKKIDQNDIEFLKSTCGSENVFHGDDINDDYSRDEMTPENMRAFPEVLVKVTSTDQVSKILSHANQHLIPVTPRGQGTGLVMGAVALDGGIMIDLSLMNKILELDEKNLTMEVEAGALIMEVRAKAEENGLFYPPMPGEQSATIGGNVSTNAGGLKAVKYGVTRDYVRGIEVVLPTGEILVLGGKIAKNSSGYSLKDLIIGSEGTLGIVTKILLRLVPLPKRAISLLVPFPDPVSAIKTVPEVIKSEVTPVAVEFMERDVIIAAEEYLGKKFPDNSADAYLLMSFDGNSKDKVTADYETIAHLCLENGALDVFISDTQERQDAIWSARGAFLEGIKASTTEMDECDVVVPISEIAEYLQFKVDLEAKYKVRVPSFAHAGDGNLHIYILKDELDEGTWKKVLRKIMGSLYDKAKGIGGQVSGEHGIGHMKKDYLRESMGEKAVELMRGIKKVFDPNNIMNPNKVC